MTMQDAAARPLSISRTLALQARATRLDDLSAATRDKLKVCLLDFLSCAFEAADLPWSREAVAVAPRTSEGATIIGTPVTAPTGDAAFANATAGHGLVREDMHAASIGHHGVVIWPVLLALSQRAPISGAAFLSAAAVGYEVGGRLGRALFNADLARLFRPTGLLGPIAGAAAGSRLLDLSESQTMSALALGANTSGGLNQWPHEGSSDMYFHPGFAARAAILAVDLARAGAVGSDYILEGEAGLAMAFRRAALSQPVTLFPRGQAEVLAVYNKPAPACNFAQTATQAALRVAQQIDRRETIREVTVLLPDAAIRYPGCDFAGPYERALQAKMSIQYGVAAALVRKAVEEDNYRRLDEPEILRVASLIRLERDGEFTARFPAAQGAEVVVQLAGGATISRRLVDVIPATESEIRQRFRVAAGALVGAERAEEIEERVDGLDEAPDAGRIATLCAAPVGGAPRAAATALHA